MGCSPSKGNNFGPLGPMRKGRMLPAAPPERPRDSHVEEEDNRNATGSTNGDSKERKAAVQPQVIQKDTHMTPQKQRSVTELSSEAVHIEKLGSEGVDNNTVSQRKEKQVDKQDVIEKKPSRKPKKNTRGNKVLKKKDKDKDKPPTEQKVDFPEPLVNAHQAAYAFLNPSINKYDVLLGLLEQATQTQVSVQPMVAFMALRYEGIIRGLEEMADEGEKVLKENGEHLAWPSKMKNLSSSPPQKSGSAINEPPPDLLQQLLQYTTQRMRNVSEDVCLIGDSAMEEAVEYFASVSEVLEEKLKVKRSVETRLMQLLSRIEMASVRKPGPEDYTLFSEDSGIGAESESLAGSERRLRRESCGSTGTNRTTPVSPMGCTSMNIRQGVSRQRLASQISRSVSLNSLISLGSTCTMMADDQRDSLLGSFSLDDEDEDDDEEGISRGMGNMQAGFTKRTKSSPVDRGQHLPQKCIENPQNVEMPPKKKHPVSGRIQFVTSQNASAKPKVVGSPKTGRRQVPDEEERSPKLQTAASTRKAVVKKTAVTRERRSLSAESLRSKGEDSTLPGLDRTQKNANERLQRVSKSKAGGNLRNVPSKQNQGASPAKSPALNCKHPSLENNSNHKEDINHKEKAGLTRHNNKKQEVTSDEEKNHPKDLHTSKGPIKATPPPSPPSSPRPSSGLRRGRNSVKKLIDTFSQGIEELDSPKVLGPLKGVRKCGVPVLPGLGNMEAVLSTGITSCRPDNPSSEKNIVFDPDSLPPPPLEVLMDNSFESAQSLLTGVADERATKVGKSPGLKRAAISQRLRASVQSVLPCKGGLPQASKVISHQRADQKDTIAPSKVSLTNAQLEAEPEKETNALDQQAKKITRRGHSSDSESSSTSCVATNQSASQGESADTQDGDNHSVPVTNNTVPTVPPSSLFNSQPPATPPVSRGRMLPSTPSTPNSLHRRLPSPHNFKGQPSPPSSASPPVNRILPTPQAVQKRLPSPPCAKQNVVNSNSSTSYPLKGPSPPASPKLKRWSNNVNPNSSPSYLFKSPSPPASPQLQRWSNNVNSNSPHSYPFKAPSPPASPQVQRWSSNVNPNSPPSYPFKAPSPPASPQLQRWSRENSCEDLTSARKISNARSVFGPASPSLFKAQTCPVPRPPQGWTSTRVSFLSRAWESRGRFPVSTQGHRPFIQRSHSDRRSSLRTPPRTSGISVAESCGSEPAIYSQGLDDEPIRDDELWGSQSDLRATPRSVSQPDLCVVGHAFHRD